MGNPPDPSDPPASRALVIGRFQPPHRGHLQVLEAAADAAREVIVVVGSAQRSHVFSDPLTAGERMEALRGLLLDGEVKVDYMVPVPDLGQYHLWVAHVAAHVPAFDVVVAANPLTLHLFSKAGYDVKRVEPINRDQWSGTEIRRRLLAGEPIGDEVTPRVARFLEQEEIQARFEAIAGSRPGASG